MTWLLLTLGVLSTVAATTAAGYCSVNTLPTNSSWMQFTKEPVPLEYGFEDKFKSIHCCVKGYRSIEWFKDGVAYPWSAGVSNLILYPEAANQTLYTQRAARGDSGNYTCRMSNETHSETHTVRLDILEKPTGTPRTMFISKDQWVEEGTDLRLYCEALIGRSYLADARSDLRWMKVWPNGTEGDLLPTQTEIKTTRDDVEDIIGSYLRIERVAAPDYGMYACVVHSNDHVDRKYVTVHYKFNGLSGITSWSGDSSIPWRPLVLGIVAGALLLVSLIMLHRRYTLRLLLAARQARARTATAAHRARVLGIVARALLLVSLIMLHRRYTLRLLLAARQARARTATAAHRAKVLEKEFDVLVCWTAVDAELVRGALLPTLALKYQYRVHTLQLATRPDHWYNEVMSQMARCRSVLAVLSPAQYAPQQLLTALRQLRALPLPPVVVLLQDLPKLKREAKEGGERLSELVSRTRVVAWRHVHERAFWTQLRLELPLPPPPPETLHIKNESTDNKNSCSGSLTALV